MADLADGGAGCNIAAKLYRSVSTGGTMAQSDFYGIRARQDKVIRNQDEAASENED